MRGSQGYSPTLGTAAGRVSKDVTRIEFGGHIGVFDWLTIGAVLPWTRTRTNVDLYFSPDTLNGDLGLNPISTDLAGVNTFPAGPERGGRKRRRRTPAQCVGARPGSPSCLAAQSLADRTATFSASASTAYGAQPFFPIAGSSTATELDGAAAALDADLVAAGLTGIGAPDGLRDRMGGRGRARGAHRSPGVRHRRRPARGREAGLERRRHGGLCIRPTHGRGAARLGHRGAHVGLID